MKTFSLILFVLIVASMFTAQAFADGWNFPLAISYVSGFRDVGDRFEDNLRAGGNSVSDVSYWPVGLSASPYYQYDNGFGIGGSIGPLQIISADPYFYIDVPVGIDGRYTFNLAEATSPYVRLGVREHIASGDFVVGKTPGLFAAAGVEFLKKKENRVHFGLELAYDGGIVKFENKRTNGTEQIKPGGVMLSVYAIF
jgi:hypothetical protein